MSVPEANRSLRDWASTSARWAGTRPNLAILTFLFLVTVAFFVADFSFGPISGRDFLNYWFGPRALWTGVNPYDQVAYSDFGLTFFPHGRVQQFNFTYPPHSLFVFAPFGLPPLSIAFGAWDVLSLIMFYIAARPLLPRGLPAFLAVLSPATILCLEFGQTGLLSSALFLMGARGSGVAAAVLTFKPHLGLLVAPALFLKGRKPVLVAVAGTIILVVASQLVFGHWKDFFEHASGSQASQLFNADRKNTWYIMGTTPAIGYGLKGMVIYAIVGSIVLSRNFNIFTAATATFVISPYGFHYDMSAACLGFAVLIFSYWQHMALWQRLVASLAFLTPIIVQFGTWWVPPILLLGLFVQTQHFPGVQLTWKRGRPAVAAVNGLKPSGACYA